MDFSTDELEKTPPTSRRNLLKWGMLGVGTAVLATMPSVVAARPKPYIKTLVFNADDIGILNFALLLEELESAFYVLALRSGKIKDPKEYDYLQAISKHEATHVKFLRKVLGNNTLFNTNDLRLSVTGLNAVLKDRDTILNTAVALEDTGVHAYNGAGTQIKNPTYLLAAGSIVSIEARHSVGVRALLRRPATQPISDDAIARENLVPEINPFYGRAYDELYTPKQIISIVSSLNILRNPITGALVA